MLGRNDVEVVGEVEVEEVVELGLICQKINFLHHIIDHTYSNEDKFIGFTKNNITTTSINRYVKRGSLSSLKY